MISATTVPTTIARFADALPLINIDLSRFVRNDSIKDEALAQAYRQFSERYGNWVEASFDEAFLTHDGATIIQQYAARRLERHEAAIALARAWAGQLGPVRSSERKRRTVDATMAADNLLRWYDSELTGVPMAEPATDAPAAAESALSLFVDVSAKRPNTAHVEAGGVLDRNSCDLFLAQTQQLYQQGVRSLTLDLGDVTELTLSGVYALHGAAKIFNGERHVESEYGLAGLRHMAEENLEAGVHEHIRLLDVHPSIIGKLEQTGVAEMFGIRST